MKRLLFLLMLSACTSTEETLSTLQKAGFRDIVVGGVTGFACSEEDKMGRSFTATNGNGQSIDGVVCCGIFKGCTVRF